MGTLQLAEIVGHEVLLISAVTGQGLNDLVGRIAKTLQGEPAWQIAHNCFRKIIQTAIYAQANV
jgi:hypothetical protein